MSANGCEDNDELITPIYQYKDRQSTLNGTLEKANADLETGINIAIELP